MTKPQNAEDENLKRMLKMPPKEHAPIGKKKPSRTDAARTKIMKLWHALPQEHRKSDLQASLFAAKLTEKAEFKKLGHPLIHGWLLEDLD